MRVYSHAQSLEQHHNRDEVLQHPCHIENICYRLAVKNRGQYGKFLRAVETLRATGRLKDGELQKKVQGVVQEARSDGHGQHRRRCFPYHRNLSKPAAVRAQEGRTRQGATICVAVRCDHHHYGRSKHGDPAESRDYFEASNFAALIKKGWPTTFLNVEYRAAGLMCPHTARGLYAKYIISSAQGTIGVPVRKAPHQRRGFAGNRWHDQWLGMNWPGLRNIWPKKPSMKQVELDRLKSRQNAELNAELK